jgi:hypothetical protein
VHRYDRDHKQETAEEAAGDDPAARSPQTAGTFEDAVADDAAQGVADYPGQENARREQRRMRQVEMKVMEEEGRNPAEKQP